jgi:DNA-binding response OmpR family regulator
MNRVALVEDHERLAALIRTAFGGTGIEIEPFERLSHARSASAEVMYSAWVVDRGLGDGDGLDLVREFRSKGNQTPCLMLTARDALHDRVEGLEAGADDYLVKPFLMDELVARVRALLRRPALLQDLTPEFSGVQVLPGESLLRCDARRVALASAELQIMLCLVKAQGRAVRRTALEMAGWGLGDGVTRSALDVAVHRLRKKLQDIGSELELINMRGLGYALAHPTPR